MTSERSLDPDAAVRTAQTDMAQTERQGRQAGSYCTPDARTYSYM